MAKLPENIVHCRTISLSGILILVLLTIFKLAMGQKQPPNSLLHRPRRHRRRRRQQQRCHHHPVLLKHELAYCLGQTGNNAAISHLTSVLEEEEPLREEAARRRRAGRRLESLESALPGPSTSSVVSVAETYSAQDFSTSGRVMGLRSSRWEASASKQ